jgi:hypothetical protein
MLLVLVSSSAALASIGGSHTCSNAMVNTRSILSSKTAN